MMFDDVFTADSAMVLFEVLIKLGLGAVLGGAIGYERERSGRPAGIRTHMLMVIGVVIFSEVSKGFAVSGDPSRIAAQVVTGVGFLGAGTILRMGVEIKGLTTAASLWAAASIGMALSAGGGYILAAVLGTILTLMTLAYVAKLERKLVPYAHPVSMQVELSGPEKIALLLDAIHETGAKTKSMRVVSSEPLHLQVDVLGDNDKCMEAVARTEGVHAASWMD